MSLFHANIRGMLLETCAPGLTSWNFFFFFSFSLYRLYITNGLAQLGITHKNVKDTKSIFLDIFLSDFHLSSSIFIFLSLSFLLSLVKWACQKLSACRGKGQKVKKSDSKQFSSFLQSCFELDSDFHLHWPFLVIVSSWQSVKKHCFPYLIPLHEIILSLFLFLFSLLGQFFCLKIAGQEQDSRA